MQEQEQDQDQDQDHDQDQDQDQDQAQAQAQDQAQEERPETPPPLDLTDDERRRSGRAPVSCLGIIIGWLGGKYADPESAPAALLCPTVLGRTWPGSRPTLPLRLQPPGLP